jgi:hypothetical protein
MQHLSETDRGRNARHRLSPQERAKACLVIHELIALESIQAKTARREVWARLVIGLPPRPRRTVNLDAAQ